MYRNLYAKPCSLSALMLFRLASALCCLLLCASLLAQQPAEPSNVNPIDGQSYYLINQLSGLQADLNNGSTTAGDSILIQNRSFSSLSQRWAMTALPGAMWAISNLSNGLCLDSSSGGGSTTWVVQNPCSPTAVTQQWSFSATSNGYVTVTNHGTGLVLDVAGGANTAGTRLEETGLNSPATQSQQWLLRPVFFRGIDNALLEKQEAERVSESLPWWQDAGQTGDVLQILKNHGVNMVRVRPTSEPPYNSYTPTTCSGNGCYAETDAQDIDLAKRAKQLGMSVELTLFFDGGSSKSIPGGWSSDSLTQAETDVYNYVKSEVEAYRKAGAMPDMVTIGNEVDTGFFGSLASPSGSNFGPFAALEKQAMQAVLDASSDTSIGAPLPPPIRCIHITPGWNLTDFFTDVNSAGIPYDAMCQSYYPIYHGPLTSAQAASSNPNNQPVEEITLINAANSIGKPIFIIETGEHYENGFDSNDPWYPATRDGQRQFLIDLDSVLKNLPNHLGMGMEYWDPAGVNLPKSSGGGYVNGDGSTDAIFTWNGLTLFDNADSSGSTNTAAGNYSALLPAADALGGRLDPTLAYKLVNIATGQVLQTAGAAGSNGIALGTAADSGAEALSQQWTITSNGDGTFQIANQNVTNGATPEVLDNGGSSTAGATVTAQVASSGSTAQAWDILSAGGGNYAIVNQASGMVLTSSSGIVQEQPTASNSDWITTADASQQWKIVPVNITAASTATALAFDSSTPSSLTYGAALGIIQVNLLDSSGSLVLTSGQSVTLTISGPGGYSHTSTATAANGSASFDLSSLTPGVAGSYTLTATSGSLTAATAGLTVNKATLTVAANDASRAYGDANPSFTYSVTGFVNGDNNAVLSGSAALSTSATASSDPGSYPIIIAAGTLAAANYNFIFANGTLTVNQAATMTTLSTSASTVYPGQNITLTATVTSPSAAVPTGTVNFVSGSTTLGSSTLNASGIATLATSSLQPGSNSIQAEYAGNTDFSASTSTAVTVTQPDFSISGGQTNVTLPAGGSSTVNLTLTPAGGYQGTITMSCNSSLANVSCAFNPATYTSDGSNTVLTGTVTLTASSTTAMTTPFLGGNCGVFFAATFFFPGLLLAGMRKRRHSWLVLALVLAGTLSLTACGGGGSSGGGTTTTGQQTGTVTLQAAGSTGSVMQSLTINVTVQ
jgi:arabinogalactan endo-1,4-beta-galactosidase